MTKQVLTAILAAGLAAPLGAQSLGEVAARDRARRAGKGSPSPAAYTDTDLRGSPPPSPSPGPSATPPPAAAPVAAGPRPKGWKAPASSPAPVVSPAPGQPAATPAPTPAPPDTSGQERAALEAQWKGIATQRRADLARLEAQIPALEEKIAALRNDMSPTNLGDPNREQNRQAAIGQAQAELEAAKAGLAAAQKAVEDLEADVVRAGGLPGWVR